MSDWVLHDVEGDPTLHTFWCPGCGCGHYFRTATAPPGGVGGQCAWTWDGNRERPTVSPSILVQYDGADAGVDGTPPKRCHFFIVAGELQFLTDCTHGLAGKTVPMEAW